MFQGVYRVSRLDIKRDGTTSKSLNEDLHSAAGTRKQMTRLFLQVPFQVVSLFLLFLLFILLWWWLCMTEEKRDLNNN